MRRDMDLVREILLAIEKNEKDPLGWIDLELPNRSRKEVAYHVMLLHQAGLVTAKDLCTNGPDGFDWRPKSLTWQGHEFLEAARNDTIWHKAVGKMVEVTGGVSLDVLKDLLIASGKQALGLSA